MSKPGTKRPAMGKGRGGPAKGASAHKSLRMAAPFDSDTAYQGHEKAKETFAKRRAAREQWRRDHPEFEGVNSLSPKQTREYLAMGLPPLLDKLLDIGLDDDHPRQIDAIKIATEQVAGRPPQAIEHSGDMKMELKGYAVAPPVAATMAEWTQSATAQIEEQSEE